ncbi:hypothetical protein ECP03047993_3175 [Escherichia coli P0304799.3]|nr:hypothetical protein ECP03047993_3175 [Escherichia coli P0304799.3]
MEMKRVHLQGTSAIFEYQAYPVDCRFLANPPQKQNPLVRQILKILFCLNPSFQH